MSVSKLGLVAVLCSAAVAAQSGSVSVAALGPQTTLPIAFTRTVDANHAKPGEIVTARTLQVVRLADGREVKAGAPVLGHVSEAQRFLFNKTPYAKQVQAVLGIEFDTLGGPEGEKIPLHVYLRAMADSFTTNAAYEPRPGDEDPLHSTTQIGGDIFRPSQGEIIDRDGDVVGYNKPAGAFAHLIASAGAGAARCDGSNTEQAMGRFSASACGLYGFRDVALTSTGLGSDPSGFMLTSSRRSPEIIRHSTALLEVVPSTDMAAVSR